MFWSFATDFVLNEGEYYKGSLTHHAALVKESIPWQISVGEDSTAETATAVMFEWRPDPALYLSILCGQLIVNILDGDSQTDYRLDLAVHVAGWKSMLGSGKKRRRSKKGGKKHGRKRHSKK